MTYPNDFRTGTPSVRASATDDLSFGGGRFHALVSWRSVLAGLFLSAFTLAIFLSLGMAFGGSGLNGGTTAQGAGVFTGIWFIISSLVSLFVGAYFAARISNLHTNRLGSAQGLVIASVFFGILLYQTMLAVGWAGRTAGETIGGAAAAASMGMNAASNSSAVSSVVERAIGDLNLKSDPETVVSGVATRLVRGDTESAKNYLAYQAGITPAEANQRLLALRAQVDQAMIQAREAAAKGLQATGWTLFITMLIGAAAAVAGGALGTMANVRRPFREAEQLAYSAPLVEHRV